MTDEQLQQLLDSQQALIEALQHQTRAQALLAAAITELVDGHCEGEDDAPQRRYMDGTPIK